MTASRRARISVLLLMPMLMLWAPAGAQTEKRDVRAQENSFQPLFLEVNQGAEVTWIGSRGGSHTVTTYPGTDVSFDSHPECSMADNSPDRCLSSGRTFRYAFSTPGTFDYYCKVHGRPEYRPDPRNASDPSFQQCGMCGSITVRAASRPGGPPAPPAPAAPTGGAGRPAIPAAATSGPRSTGVAATPALSSPQPSVNATPADTRTPVPLALDDQRATKSKGPSPLLWLLIALGVVAVAVFVLRRPPQPPSPGGPA
ncbi:MAG TPA: plastocyanin/azurin family copper-binding protein [Actinomycetota bacterium]|nr:plastocyanin/azurin family copper-binding protein [Actinomycetota bacterium]